MAGKPLQTRLVRWIALMMAALVLFMAPSSARQPDYLAVPFIAQTKGPRAQVELSLETVLPTAPPRLMTYRILRPAADQEYADELAARFGVGSPMVRQGKTIMGTQGDLGLEVYPETGAFWFRDAARLWPENAPRRPIDEAEGQRLAQGLLRAWELLPPGAVYEGTGASERMIHNMDSGETHTERMDLHVNYRMTVGGLPVAGPGGKIKVYIGDGYRVIGIYWAGFETREHRELPVLSAATALEQVVKEGIATTVKGALTASISHVDLVYYAGPGTIAQEYLEPVYRFRGTVTGSEEQREFTQYVPALEPSYRRETNELPAIDRLQPSQDERPTGR